TDAASIALGPLANNGGPTLPGGQPTLTHLPAPTSVLVAGVACLPGVPTDQRGFARPGYPGAPCDIGAAQTVPLPVVTNLTPNTAPAGSPTTVVTVTGSGFLTMTQALVNGLGAPTTVVSPTQLLVTIDAANLAATGVLTISAQYGADAATRSNSLPFTVTLTSQTITFPNPGTQNPASLPSSIPVTATATSGLPVTITSQTTGVCTVSGFTVTLLTGGTCVLVANQGGNAAFAPASPVTQSFTVNAPSGGGSTPPPTSQIVIATGFRNRPLVQ
ncbi:MAG: hypothetical protein NZ518_12240, partial [Dehalococcoidia bacterium]|nr:hypothetical protein [Dehalococcoidia bacterium]